MADEHVVVAGGGIGGLAAALTLHQVGVPCVVLEAAREMRPLGVGVNLQPNAVRELYGLGFTQADCLLSLRAAGSGPFGGQIHAPRPAPYGPSAAMARP
jgi:2-polyprenyl-6-methoxyphenol hydroxylase-like FAD-dependent oxidoreductase